MCSSHGPALLKQLGPASNTLEEAPLAPCSPLRHGGHHSLLSRGTDLQQGTTVPMSDQHNHRLRATHPPPVCNQLPHST